MHVRVHLYMNGWKILYAIYPKFAYINPLSIILSSFANVTMWHTLLRKTLIPFTNVINMCTPSNATRGIYSPRVWNHKTTFGFLKVENNDVMIWCKIGQFNILYIIYTTLCDQRI